METVKRQVQQRKLGTSLFYLMRVKMCFYAWRQHHRAKKIERAKIRAFTHKRLLRQLRNCLIAWKQYTDEADERQFEDNLVGDYIPIMVGGMGNQIVPIKQGPRVKKIKKPHPKGGDRLGKTPVNMHNFPQRHLQESLPERMTMPQTTQYQDFGGQS